MKRREEGKGLDRWHGKGGVEEEVNKGGGEGDWKGRGRTRKMEKM